jgi:SAM-dependent methyltransferase
MVPNGRVYAVDTEPDMVKYLSARAQREGLKNLLAIAGKPETPALPEKVDLMFMVDVYHHIGNRPAYLRKLAGFLKPGGRLAIIDFRIDARDGPPKSARIPPAQVRRELEMAGYEPLQAHEFLPNQYFLVYKAKDNQRTP